MCTPHPLNQPKHKANRPLTFFNSKFGTVPKYLDRLNNIPKVLTDVGYKTVNVDKPMHES
jgi:hypothetical protein